MYVRPECERSERIEGRACASMRRFAATQHQRLIVGALMLVAVPAFAQDVPRDPIQMEQERRIQGHGFEQSLRQNPQLYPFAPSAPSVASPTPPSPGLAPLTPAPKAPIPPQTHVRPHRQLTPAPYPPNLPPEEPLKP